MGAGAAVSLAARMTEGQKKEDESVWVSSAKLDKALDQKFCRLRKDQARSLQKAVSFSRRRERKRKRIEKPIGMCVWRRNDPLRDLQSDSDFTQLVRCERL